MGQSVEDLRDNQLKIYGTVIWRSTVQLIADLWYNRTIAAQFKKSKPFVHYIHTFFERVTIIKTPAFDVLDEINLDENV
jgi:hypothetical protein